MTNSEDFQSIDYGDRAYPSPLELVFGKLAMPTIWYAGNLNLLDQKSVGFCGSRKASPNGLEVVTDCADQLSQLGVVVTSGYAKGVDTAAHKQALISGGATVVILSEGAKRFRIKRELKEFWDWERVLVISQFEPEAVWRGDRAMARNKLIVALSAATIVIEAGETGGTLNAGFTALEYRKPLFVAQYGEPADSAAGNTILLESGGTPLMRNRKTQKASLGRLQEAIATSL